MMVRPIAPEGTSRSICERQETHQQVDEKTQDKQIVTVRRNVFLNCLGRVFGKQWGLRKVSVQTIPAPKPDIELKVVIPQSEVKPIDLPKPVTPKAVEPPKPILKPLTPHEEMMQVIAAVSQSGDRAISNLMVEVWPMMITGSTLKKWTRLDSNKHCYRMEFEKEALGAHVWARGTIIQKSVMQIEIRENKGKIIIHFSHPGIVYRLGFFDWPLRAITIEKDRAEIKYGLLGFLSSWSFPVSTAIDFWKGVTWEKHAK